METTIFSPPRAFRTLLCAFLLTAGTTARAALFDNLNRRYSVGDPAATNPIDRTEGPKNLAVGDLDGDGLADVVAANLDGSVSVLLGDGKGSNREQLLTPARGLLEGSSLRAVVVADFDADGLLDVAAADIAREGVVILLGAGDGSLTPARRIGLGPARALATADVNADGNADVLVASSPADCEQMDECFDPAGVADRDCDALDPTLPSLSLLPGRGDGTFGPAVPLLREHPGCLYDVALVDIDQDGKVDALALDLTHRRVLVFGGLGDGRFTPRVVLETSGTGPRSFCVAHLDERLVDGNPPAGATLDIAVANRNSATLDLFFGRGALGFDAPRSIPAGDAPRDVAAGDLDGDGRLELVTTNRNADTISVFRGLGGGRFPDRPLELPTGRSPRNIVLADLTGDGFLDGAVNNRVSGDVSVFTGREGVGGFLVPRHYYAAGLKPVDVITGDFNADGLPDVASVGLRSHDIHVRVNSGGGILGDELVYDVNYEPASIVTGDVNGDGHLDLIAACLGLTDSTESRISGALVVLPGRGDGTFADPAMATDAVLSFRPSSLRLGDLSGDGVPDLAVGGIRGKLFVCRGRGDGTFDACRPLSTRETGRALNLALGDFNNDGRTDIATSQARLLLNDGRFFEPTWSGIERNFAASGPPDIDKTWFVDSADLDGDGFLDLMLALTFVRPDPIAVFFGKGDGTFHRPDIYDGPDMGVVASLARDMDGDGILDIVIGNRCAASVIILRGLGNRKFERFETVTAYAVEGLAVDDLDLDGRPDLVGVGLGLWVLLNGKNVPLTEPTMGGLPGLLPVEGIFINEVMALNREYYVDRRGATPDWVELFNYGPEPRNLDGWSLRQITRDGDQRGWAFPRATRVGSMEHLVIFVGQDRPSPGPVSGLVCDAFGLHRGGETVSLVDDRGNEVDRVVYPALPADVSYARFTDAARFFSYNPVPTMGSRNVRPGNLRPETRVENPFRLDGTIGVAGSVFDDVGVAYASVCFREEGAPGFTEIPLSDDGRHGDGFSGDGIFGATLAQGTPGSTVLYYLRAIDVEGEEVTAPKDVTREGNLFRLQIPSSPPALRISEIVADNETGLVDEAGEHEDWLELENCGDVAVSLDGLALTKDFFDADKAWDLPPGLTLAPGERAVVFCDRDSDQGPLHASFRIDRDGDQILLVRRGDPLAVLDSITFGRVPEDTALGRPACGEEPEILGQPTPGQANERALRFRRGDASGDNKLNITDPVVILLHLFARGTPPACEDSADSDDSGSLNITDGIHLLNYLFLSGPAPGDPFPGCDIDPTADALTCDEYAPCN